MGFPPLNIPRPTEFEFAAAGEARLIEVKSVSACEKAPDKVLSRTEVSPLRRLYPDTRLGLIEAGLRVFRKVVLVERSKGRGGTGMLGGCPIGSPPRLLDRGILTSGRLLF